MLTLLRMYLIFECAGIMPNAVGKIFIGFICSSAKDRLKDGGTNSSCIRNLHHWISIIIACVQTFESAHSINSPCLEMQCSEFTILSDIRKISLFCHFLSHTYKALISILKNHRISPSSVVWMMVLCAIIFPHRNDANHWIFYEIILTFIPHTHDETSI